MINLGPRRSLQAAGHVAARVPRSKLAALTATAAVLVPLTVAGCTPTSKALSGPLGACFQGATAKTPPADGTLLWGAIPDWTKESAAQYVQKIGKTPAVFSAAQPFPLDPVSLGWTNHLIESSHKQGSAFQLTLNPTTLSVVTTARSDALAKFLGNWNSQGEAIYVRFAPEMNGYWFPWGQQPTAYRTAFRTLAASVHRYAPQTAMVWAPNIATPFPIPVVRTVSAADRAALNVRGGTYSAYYPGDDAVDWVGLSLYARGNGYPRLHNDPPAPTFLLDSVGGFYDTYAVGHHRPMQLAETAAAWAANRTGAPELTVKQTWWQEIFSAVRHGQLPKLKLAVFFEVNKAESDIGPNTEWAIDRLPQIASAFNRDLTAYSVTSARIC